MTDNHAATSHRALMRKAGAFALALLMALTLMLAPASQAVSAAYASEAGKIVVAIDPGHGGSDSGAVGNGVVEAEANWAIAQACVEELNQYRGVKAVLTRSKSQKPKVDERAQIAVSKNADVLVSIHCNSVENSPNAHGSEVWRPNDSTFNYGLHTQGSELGNCILSQLSSLGLHNRGLKMGDHSTEKYPDGSPADTLGINRYSRQQGLLGIIVEHAFVTNANDAAKLKDSSWLKKMGVADATGIAAYYGLSKTQDLNKTGEAEVTALPSGYEANPAIMGDSKVTADKLAAWYKGKVGADTYPAGVYAQYGASTIDKFCEILAEEAKAEGVRAEVVFAQSMNETGWLRFGGDVKPEQCNFAGIGATGGGAGGADFGTQYKADGVRMGLRAQVQHLKAYASTDGLNRAQVDPRFHLVTRGSAPNVLGLAGKWASSTGYGHSLTRLVNDLLASAKVSTASKASATFVLGDVPASLKTSSASVYVDGVKQTVNTSNGTGTISLDYVAGDVHTIAMYDTNGGSGYGAYPTKMYVWMLTGDGGSITAQRYYAFDDLLQYAGSSIRVSGNKGIRMITGMYDQVKDALAGSGVKGYTLVETGTLIAWTNKLGGSAVTLDTSGVSRGKAYVRGSQDKVYSTSGATQYYTNVLVGNFSADQCRRSMTMRPYAILQNSAGKQFTVYGGEVERSIQYIAQQNANAFSPGTAAYNYIHGLIGS